jgi:hypothetical protein
MTKLETKKLIEEHGGKFLKKKKHGEACVIVSTNWYRVSHMDYEDCSFLDLRILKALAEVECGELKAEHMFQIKQQPHLADHYSVEDEGDDIQAKVAHDVLIKFFGDEIPAATQEETVVDSLAHGTLTTPSEPQILHHDEQEPPEPDDQDDDSEINYYIEQGQYDSDLAHYNWAVQLSEQGDI